MAVPTLSREVIALHEAGHAVAAHRLLKPLGVIPGKVSIELGAPGLPPDAGGVCVMVDQIQLRLVEQPDGTFRRQTVEEIIDSPRCMRALVVVDYAGTAACRAFVCNGHEDYDAENDRDDRAHAALLLAKLKLTEQWAAEQAKRFADRDANRRAILAVAAAWLQHAHLDAKQTASVIHAASRRAA